MNSGTFIGKLQLPLNHESALDIDSYPAPLSSLALSWAPYLTWQRQHSDQFTSPAAILVCM